MTHRFMQLRCITVIRALFHSHDKDHDSWRSVGNVEIRSGWAVVLVDDSVGIAGNAEVLPVAEEGVGAAEDARSVTDVPVAVGIASE